MSYKFNIFTGEFDYYEDNAAGTTGSVQYNDGGVLGGDSDLTWDKTNKKLAVGGTATGQSIIASGLVVNDNGGGGANDDFRVETDTEPNAFVIDASANVGIFNVNVGIGTSNPQTILHINDGTDVGTDWKGTYDKFAFTGENFVGSFVDTDEGSWGTGLAFKQVDGTVYEDLWGIVRQTDGDGSGDGSLRFGYNSHSNAVYEMSPVVIMDKNGNVRMPNDNAKLLFGAGQDASIYYDGADLNIKTNEAVASDLNIYTGSQKTVELQTKVWDDQQVQIGEVAGQGWFGNAWADIVEYRSGIALRLADSTSNNYKFKFDCQLNHKYAEGEDIQFHIHIGNNSTTSGDVVLNFTYEWANVDGTYGTATTVTKTFSVTGTDGLHQVFDFEINASGTGKKVSSILLCKVERDAGNASDTFSEDLYVIGVDFHIPLNTVGSRQEWVK